MRRRTPADPATAVPEPLRTFRAEDWRRDGEDDLAAVRRWTDARCAWHEQSDRGWPGGAVDRIRQQRATRLRVLRRLIEERP